MSGPLHVRGSITIPVTELEWRFSRASGPGGQHVNKTSSAAELVFDLAASPSLPEPYKQRALDRLAGRLNDGGLSVRAEGRRAPWMKRQSAVGRTAAATVGGAAR